MDTEIDLEHIKSLKKFSHGDTWFFGRHVPKWSTEDPDVFLTRLGTREDLVAYIVVIGNKRFAFGITVDLAISLKTYESDQLMNIWIDQILCKVIDRSPSEMIYIDFANQTSFYSPEERDVIVDLFGRLLASENEMLKGKILKKRVMYTGHAKEQLTADDVVGAGSL